MANNIELLSFPFVLEKIKFPVSREFFLISKFVFFNEFLQILDWIAKYLLGPENTASDIVFL